MHRIHVALSMIKEARAISGVYFVYIRAGMPFNMN